MKWEYADALMGGKLGVATPFRREATTCERHASIRRVWQQRLESSPRGGQGGVSETRPARSKTGCAGSFPRLRPFSHICPSLPRYEFDTDQQSGSMEFLSLFGYFGTLPTPRICLGEVLLNTDDIGGECADAVWLAGNTGRCEGIRAEFPG